MTVGTPPGTGPQLVDGAWLTGLAGGLNESYVAGIAAPNANSQATATPIPPGFAIVEVDSSVSTGSVVLPFSSAGTEFNLINNTANTVNVFAQAGNNPLTGAQDTINGLTNATAFAATANSMFVFACAKNGKWAGK